MLNRRLLRVKVLQALYAYFQSDNTDVNKAERELFHSIDRIYDLFLQLIILPAELAHYATIKLEDSKSKIFQTDADKQLTNNFIENSVIKEITSNPTLTKLVKDRGISWGDDGELVGRIFKKLKSTSAYTDYLALEDPGKSEDVDFLLFLYKNVLAKFELILNMFQDKSIYWNYDEFDYALGMVKNSLKKLNDSKNKSFKVATKYKDEEDDRKFVKELFHKTISNSEMNEKIISDKTKNWEVDRIAVLDIIMMKMALTELTEFNSIPVKVSLNEYIEISKFFSSPKSKTFINGVLDKIVPELKKEKKILKTGRGLME